MYYIDELNHDASIQSCLLLSRPPIGVWLLGLDGGVQQLLLLITKGDLRCQEISAEVLCLAAATDGGYHTKYTNI